MAGAGSGRDAPHRLYFRESCPLRTRIVSWLKIGLPLVLIAALVGHTWRHNPETWRALTENPREPRLLIASFSVILLADILTFLRWHLLLRTLHIPIRLRDTLRLGFLGHLLNFVAPGGVGGDLFKAVFVAHEQPNYRAEAVATILVDRACGVYALLLMSSAALWLSGLAAVSHLIASIAYMTYSLTVLGTIALPVVLTPRLVDSKLARRTTRVRRIGPIIQRLLDAIRKFQHSKPQLIMVGLISLSVHVLLALGIYLASLGLYENIPTLTEHFVISPLAGVAGAIPLTPGGLGSYELTMAYLYDLFSPANDLGRGLVVALCFRVTSILVASIGVVLYWLRHREVMQVLHEAEEQAAHA